MLGDGFYDRFGHGGVGAHGVVQGAVGLHVGNAGADLAGGRRQSGDLLVDVGDDLRRADIDGAPAEVGSVAIGNVRADGHVSLHAGTGGVTHHFRASGMEAAGDADAGHGGHDTGIDLGERVPLTEVGVEVDAARHISIEHVMGPWM